MPVFEFSALSESGRTVRGIRDADNAKALRQVLRKEGLFLTEVAASKQAQGSKAGAAGAQERVDVKKWLTGRVKAEDVAVTTRQLSTLIHAGIPLVEALTALVDQVDHVRLKSVISEVKQKVNEGSSLADALAQHPKVFTSLYCNMIRAGESSGALDIVLVRLADFTESQARLRQKVLGTMTYPIIMVAIGMLIIAVLFTAVIPKVTKIFLEMQVTLPWTTRALIAVSTFSRDYWYLLLGAAVLAVLGFSRWLKTAGGRHAWDHFVLRAPIFGPLVRMLSVSRFTRTLGTLLRSGVPLLTAMDIVKNIVNNVVLAKVVDAARDAVREGESIAAPLKRSGEFPPLVYHMIAIGERSGQLEEMLENVSDAYDSGVETRINALTSLLEPVMIVMMGAVVAFIVFSILMPILQMNTFVR
jgi:general secretion pathway protein F